MGDTDTVTAPTKLPPFIETEPGTTPIPEPSHRHHDGDVAHYVTRSDAAFAICGCPVSGFADGGEADCGDCLRIMKNWVDEGVWEGYGRRPGRARTEAWRAVVDR